MLAKSEEQTLGVVQFAMPEEDLDKFRGDGAGNSEFTEATGTVG